MLDHAHPSIEKIHAARGHNCTQIFALSPFWEKEFLVPSMAFCTVDASNILCRLVFLNHTKLKGVSQSPLKHTQSAKPEKRNHAPLHERAGWFPPQGRKSNKEAANGLLDSASRDTWLRSRFCLCKESHESAGLRGPSTADLPSQHNQPCSGLATHKLRISAFFPSACNC